MLLWASNNDGGIVSNKPVYVAYVRVCFIPYCLGVCVCVCVRYELFLYKYRDLAVNRCQPLYNKLNSVENCILFQLKNGHIP
jgi:hypothetical protein